MAGRFTIDVDNPLFNQEIDPIESHSRIAKVYKFRPPYMDEFFKEASRRLSLSPDNTLLDLCCGRGELSVGFADYVDRIQAIDGSREMLKNATQKSNITYIEADLNNEIFHLIESANHIVIGSAIHWIKASRLKSFIEQKLKDNGKIFISHTLLKYDGQPYTQALRDLNAKFGRIIREVDFTGAEKLRKCGTIQSDKFILTKNISFDPAFLYRNQLSYAYESFYESLATRGNQYKKEFIERIASHAKSGRLSATLVNWAIIYTRTHPPS